MAGEAPGSVERDAETVISRLLLSWVIVAVAVWAAVALVPDIHVDGGAGTYLWLALLFGLVNAILGPILRLISLPLTVITLGLFALVVNGVLLATTAGLSSKLAIDNFWSDILGALIISIVTAVLHLVLAPKDHKAGHAG